MAPASGPCRPPSQPATQSKEGCCSVAGPWQLGKERKEGTDGRPRLLWCVEVERWQGWGQKAHRILDQVPFPCPPAFFLTPAQLPWPLPLPYPIGVIIFHLLDVAVFA